MTTRIQPSLPRFINSMVLPQAVPELNRRVAPNGNTGFVPAAKQAPSATPAHIPLPSMVLSNAAPVARGPLDLSSAEARKAIATAEKAFAGAQLAATGQTLTPVRVEKDELGMTHVRLARTVDGLPVFGSQVIAHLDGKGQVAATSGAADALKFAASARLAPKLSGAQAEKVAEKAFAGLGVKPQGEPTSQLLFYKTADGQLHKAYQVTLTNVSDADVPLKMNYFVDAQSGKVLKSFNQIDTGFVAKPGSGLAGGAGGLGSLSGAMVAPDGGGAGAAGTTTRTKGKGYSLYDGQVQLGTTKLADGSYILKDGWRGGGETWDAGQQDPASGHKRFHDANNVWGEKGDSKREKAAVDAHYGMEMTWDTYKGLYGRNSIDDKGEALNSYVHVGSQYVNAYWDGEKMNYGDGDGKDASALTALDVAGHEITHGLTERTAGLIYDGESGGLNEAMSDILGGVGVEYYASKRNKNVKWDYTIGEDVWTPGKKGDALRYMGDPTKDGYSIDNYKNYPKQTEVHGSSGIANNAFYLLSHGGKNRTSGQGVTGGIGPEKSLKIFERALTYYMTPDETFAQAKQSCIKAANDLYGASSVEAQKVAQAWSAVGVK